MNLREKYKWAIDLAKRHYDNVVVRELKWGWALAIRVDRGNESRAIKLQHPILKGTGENIRLVGLYELHNTRRNNRKFVHWLKTCFNEKPKGKTE